MQLIEAYFQAEKCKDEIAVLKSIANADIAYAEKLQEDFCLKVKRKDFGRQFKIIRS